MTDAARFPGHAVVWVRCARGHARPVHPNEIPDGLVPVCDKDHKIMMPIQAETCWCDWQPGGGDGRDS